MKTALKLLCRVVRRRLAGGEDLEKILKDYPRLTEAELGQLRTALG